ncbi:hypothetical protein B0H13DRAFT_1020047 [Mycena leptocephala]|nr:hypothetical protein B0H13DRAFT_1020047 [Mycena leptocephala]
MKVIVDDNDSLVEYNFVQANGHSPDGWIREGKAPEFEASVHASATSGNTAKLTFNGTSISVFGSLAGLGNGFSTWKFDIDGTTSGSYDAPPASARIQNQHFWTSPDLDAKSHTLTITVDQDSSINPSRTILLDYFVYTPTSAAGKTILSDDSDESISYSPEGWQSLTNSTNFLESTQHVSESAGSWVALTFEGNSDRLALTQIQCCALQGPKYRCMAPPQTASGHLSTSTITRRCWDSLKTINSGSRLCYHLGATP